MFSGIQLTFKIIGDENKFNSTMCPYSDMLCCIRSIDISGDGILTRWWVWKIIGHQYFKLK
ncbi:hypothetical protein EMIT036CA2_40120 [Chryseobacterium sp. IT-36CA2]